MHAWTKHGHDLEPNILPSGPATQSIIVSAQLLSDDSLVLQASSVLEVYTDTVLN